MFDTLIQTAKAGQNALVLGLGGGMTANLLTEKNYKVTAVEFDERIISVSKKYFNLNDQAEIHCADARYYLNKIEKKYDLILFDLYNAEEQPCHVLTTESLQKLKQNLNDSAMIYINWHGFTDEGIGDGSALLYNTLKYSGFNISLCSKSENQNYRNIIFVCSLMQMDKLPYLIHDKFTVNSFLNTDDKPMLESFNAEANKSWRTNYLKYYQNNK